jgi:hypothetical protein
MDKFHQAYNLFFSVSSSSQLDEDDGEVYIFSSRRLSCRE